MCTLSALFLISCNDLYHEPTTRAPSKRVVIALSVSQIDQKNSNGARGRGLSHVPMEGKQEVSYPGRPVRGRAL